MCWLSFLLIEWYGGVQNFMWMCEDNIVEVPFDKEF